MTYKLVYRKQALRDISELWNYIAVSAAPKVADDYISEITNYCDRLTAFPHLGRSREDVRPGIRTIGFKRKTTIVFSVTGNIVAILGIFHGGRDYEELLAELN